MRHVISMGAKRYTFMKRSDLQPGETPMAFTQVSARHIINPMMRNPKSNRVLRILLKEVSAFAILAKLGDTEVSAQLVKRMASGQIIVTAKGRAAAAGQKNGGTGGDKKSGPPKEDKPAPKVLAATAQDDVHWIKFKVVDEKDQPLKGIKLNLALGGKEAKSHGVDGAFLHIKDLAPGTCDIKSVDSDDVYEVVEFKG